jgi:hypothetical protein
MDGWNYGPERHETKCSPTGGGDSSRRGVKDEGKKERRKAKAKAKVKAMRVWEFLRSKIRSTRRRCRPNPKRREALPGDQLPQNVQNKFEWQGCVVVE